MAERQVLQEFLAKLGFQVDQPSMKSFLTQLKNNCITVSKLGAGLVGAGVAAEGMAAIFARSSEKLYYASQRIKGSAGNIQAVEFAAKQIGLSGDDARASLEGLAAVMRRPHAGGLLDMLGVQSGGDRDAVEVLLDTVQQLKQQFSGDQYFVGEGFAESLGIDKRSYLMMSQRIDELRKFYAERKQMAGNAGVDAGRAAKAGQEYMRGVNELWEKLGLLGDKMKIELLEPFQAINAQLSEMVTNFTKWLSSDAPKNFIRAWRVEMIAIGQGMAELAAGFSAIGEGKKGAEAPVVRFARALDAFMMNTPEVQAAAAAAAKGGGNLQVSIPGSLDQPGVKNSDYALPGYIDDRGTDNALFLYDRMKRSRDPAHRFRLGNELDSVLAPSTDATLGTAVGNGGVHIEVTSTVQVSGARDPEATANAVERTQRRVMGDVVRNLEGAVR